MTFFRSIWELQVTIRVSSAFAMFRSDFNEILATVNDRIRIANREEKTERVKALKQLSDSLLKQREEQHGEEKVRKELGKVLVEDKLRVR